MPQKTPFDLTEKELIGLYMTLKMKEQTLDDTMARVLLRIEKILYGRLTVEDMENIEKAYERNR
jgi:hypothetical protein